MMGRFWSGAAAGLALAVGTAAAMAQGAASGGAASAGQQPGAPGVALAADVALVNALRGEASYVSGTSAPQPARAFMRVREGDRFTVPAGASLRLVYVQGGRQETWKGPASFRVGERSAAATRGTPEVSQLPAVAPARLARVPDLLQAARLGGVTVRGAARVPPLSAADEAELQQARETYRGMRAAAEADDVTPELLFAAALSEFTAHARLREDWALVARELRRRQPSSPEMSELAGWAEARSVRN